MDTCIQELTLGEAISRVLTLAKVNIVPCNSALDQSYCSKHIMFIGQTSDNRFLTIRVEPKNIIGFENVEIQKLIDFAIERNQAEDKKRGIT